MESKFCTKIELGDQIIDAVYNITKHFTSFPEYGSTLSNVEAATFVMDGIAHKGLKIENTALDCEDIPVAKLQRIVDNQFNKVTKETLANENLVTLRNIRNFAEQQLMKLERLVNKLENSSKDTSERMKDSEAEDLISKINKFSQYFHEEKARIESHIEYGVISEEIKFLDLLNKEAENNMPRFLLKIIDQDLAISDSAEDKIARKVQSSLYYGTLTYITVMYYLLKKYSDIVDYYYQDKQLDNYNKYFTKFNDIFLNFKRSLTGKKEGTNGKNVVDLLQIVIKIMEREKIMDFDDSDSIYIDVIKKLKQLRKDMENMILPLILETPENDIKAFFKDPIVEAPIGQWKTGAKVSYALQFTKDGLYSKISKWSEPFQIQKQICPFLRMSVDAQKRKRLIFRRFDNDKPQLIGVVDPGETKFRDIHRDVYELSGSADEASAVAKIESLLKAGANVNTEFENGRKAIHAAAEQGNYKIAIKFLLKNTTNKKDINGYTPLHIAALSGQPNFVKMLVNRNGEINAQTSTNLLTPLHIASQNGFYKVVNILLDSPKINVNIKNSFGFTPLHHAILGGERVINLLIKHPKVNVNPKAVNNISPLHLACVISSDAVKILINNSQVDINAADINGVTPLHIAVFTGDLYIVKKLIAKPQIDVNAKTHNGKWTPLHFAIFLKKINETFELLKVTNIDINTTDINGVSLLHLAVAKGLNEVVTALLSKKANIEQKTIEGLTPLHLACLLKESSLAILLIEKGANIAAKTNRHSTPLHYAASAGRDEIVRKLVEKSADLNAKDKDGSEPFYLAAENDHIEVMKFLIEKGAIFNDDDKRFPLFYESIRKGNLNIVKYLIDSDIIDMLENDHKRLDLNNTNKAVRYWAMCDAIESGHLEIVKYFYERVFIYMCPPVLKSVQSGQLNILKYFLEDRYLNVDGLDDRYSLPPLFAAVINNDMVIIEYLLEKDANINLIWDDKSCLVNAIQKKNLRMVKYLVKKGADLEFKDSYGNTLLYYAVQSLDILKYLILEKHLDINAQNNKKKSVLDLAAKYADKEIIEFLCSMEPKPKEIDIKAQIRFGRRLHETCSKQQKRRDVIDNIYNNPLTIQEQGSSNKKSPLYKNERKIVNFENKLKQPYFNQSKDIYRIHLSGSKRNLKHIENMRNSHNLILNDIDPHGALLLMNVVLRKLTRDKFRANSEKSVSTYEAQAAALNIVEILQKILNNRALVEEIDFSKIHQNIFKAIMTERPYDVPMILCSNLKFSSIAGQERIANVFTNTIQETEFNQSFDKLIRPLIHSVCYSTNNLTPKDYSTFKTNSDMNLSGMF